MSIFKILIFIKGERCLACVRIECEKQGYAASHFVAF